MSEKKPILLIVDDEADIVSVLKRTFEDEYDVRTSTNPAEALDLLDENVHVVLSDQRMPQMQGYEFLKLAREKFPDTVRLIMSGYSDMNALIEAINAAEIFKFIPKPWDFSMLQDVLKQSVERYRHNRLTSELLNGGNASHQNQK